MFRKVDDRTDKIGFLKNFHEHLSCNTMHFAGLSKDSVKTLDELEDHHKLNEQKILDILDSVTMPIKQN